MFCSNCGTKIDDNAKFCMNCGAKVISAANVQAPSVSSTDTVYPVQPVPAQTAQSDQTYMPQGTIFPMGYSPAKEAAKAAAATENPVEIPKQPVAEIPVIEPQPQVQVPEYNTQATPVQPVVPTYAAQPQVQMPQYAAPPVQATPKKKKGKAGLIVLAVVLVLALALGGLYYFKSYRPRQQAKDYFDKALEAYNTGDYDTAIEYSEKAYAMFPDNEAAEEVLYSLYYEAYSKSSDDGDIGKALEYLKKMATLPMTDQDNLHTLLNSEYNIWLLQLIMEGKTDEAMDVLKEAEPYLTAEEYAERLDMINGDFDYSDDDGADAEEPDNSSSTEEPDDGQKPVVENVTSIETLAQRIAGLTDNGNFDTASFILPLYKDYVFPAINEEGTITVKLDSSFEYGYVKFYPHPEQGDDVYYVYYGDMDASGKRQGEGWILSNYTYDGSTALYFYNADWENDAANGFFIEYNVWGQEFENYNCYYGHVKDYLYDGDITIVWQNGIEYHATYNNGIPEIFGTDPDDGQMIVALDETGDYWLKVPESTAKTPVGVEKL